MCFSEFRQVGCITVLKIQIKEELIDSSKEVCGVTSEGRYLLGRRILLMA